MVGLGVAFAFPFIWRVSPLGHAYVSNEKKGRPSGGGVLLGAKAGTHPVGDHRMGAAELPVDVGARQGHSCLWGRRVHQRTGAMVFGGQESGFWSM